MGRAPCCDKANVKRGPWSPEEDAKLKDFIDKHGTGGNWIALPQKAGLKRCGKSCRLRWLNYLRPNIKHGEFSEDEDRIIYNLYANIGSRWSIIASHLPGRTDNDIKNYWNTKLRKKVVAMLPTFQKKPSFLPLLPPPPLTHQDSHFLNPSSYFYNNMNPNFMNVSNNIINSTLLPTTTNVNNLFSQVPLSPNPNLIGMISNEKQYYLGFQNQNNMIPEIKERMVMFGYGGGEMSQVSYNNDHGYMMTNDNKQKGSFKNLEEVNKQVIGSSGSINVDINSYLMNDHDHDHNHDDENKTTHIITDEFYRMIDGGN